MTARRTRSGPKEEIVMAINTGKLEEFLGRFVADLGTTIAAGSVVIGHRLGLYQALAAGPARAEELAARTGTSPRYIAEWLCGQAAGGYVEYDPATGAYSMTEEQAFALANPDGGVYVPGAFVLALGGLKAEQRIAEAFRTGAGLGRRHHRRQPQPHRPHLLQRLHPLLRPERPVPGRWLHARRTSRRGRHQSTRH
jgi:transcriptional regulator with XRE-family HTH domain